MVNPVKRFLAAFCARHGRDCAGAVISPAVKNAGFAFLMLCVVIGCKPKVVYVYAHNPEGAEENRVDKGDLDGVTEETKPELFDPQGKIAINNFTLHPPLHLKIWGANSVWLGSYEDEQFNCIAEIYKNLENNQVAVIRFKHVDNIDKFMSSMVIGTDEQ